MSISEEYEGVKFECIFVENEFDFSSFIDKFKEIAKILDKNNWAPDNGGNYSIKLNEGFVITTSGSCFSDFKDKEIVLVTDINVDAKKVYYYGTRKPSSESILHFLIYRDMNCNAILHCHADKMTQSEKLIEYRTEKEYPYGTMEFANATLKKLKETKDFTVINNHGIISIGNDLDECMKIIKEFNKLI